MTTLSVVEPHVPFLTGVKAYRRYVAYWKGKLEERVEADQG